MISLKLALINYWSDVYSKTQQRQALNMLAYILGEPVDDPIILGNTLRY